MRRREKTYELAKFLLDTPTVVADVFRIGVDNPPEKVAAEINNRYAMPVPMSTHYVRKIYHRQHPFSQPTMFSKVDVKDAEEITSRFRMVVKHDKPEVEAETCPSNHISLLTGVLEARLAYQCALNKAIDAGMSEKSVAAWCDVVAKGDLNDHS